jgi:hypothetical protein
MSSRYINQKPDDLASQGKPVEIHLRRQSCPGILFIVLGTGVGRTGVGRENMGRGMGVGRE